VVIFITAPKDNEWAPLDIGMCAENIMLAAKSLGLDTCPVGLAKFVEKTKIYGKLNIPETEKVMLAVIMGYGDELAEPKERKRDNAVFIS
jgi:nitroreductase